MDNEFNELKITDTEISENNVKSAPDSLAAQGDTTTKDVKNIFDRLPELVALKFNTLLDYLTDNFEKLATAILLQKAEKLGGGNMLKEVYDTDGDGVVDNAAMLGGQLPSYYATAEEAQTAQTTADNALAMQKGEISDTTRTAEEIIKEYVNNMPRNAFRYVTTWAADRNAMWLCGTYTYDHCGFAIKLNYDGGGEMYMLSQDAGVWSSSNVAGSDLLWTNASPTSEFGEQYIFLDLSKYSSVKIVFTDGYTVELRKVGKAVPISLSYIVSGTTSLSSRVVTVYGDSVFFTAAYNSSNGNYSLRNDLLIPYYIFGIN